jgi:hypothetical protein
MGDVSEAGHSYTFSSLAVIVKKNRRILSWLSYFTPRIMFDIIHCLRYFNIKRHFGSLIYSHNTTASQEILRF